MTITRKQIKDLRPGDVVELCDSDHVGVTVRGPLREKNGTLHLGPHIVRWDDGKPFRADRRTLTVVSRAPSPLYVNHPRTEPVPGDVVRDADGDDRTTWVFGPVEVGSGRLSNPWHNPADDSGRHVLRDRLPARLRLLVDGETGQVVP